MSIPQRAYIYLAAFVAFAVLLQGAYGIATDLARSAAWFRPGGDALATWIAMIIVGLPVWLVHDLLLRRAVIKYPEEAGSALRKLYIHGALALSTLYIFFGSIQIIEEIAGDFTGLEHIGGVLVAAGLWYYLWRREDLEGQPSSRAQTVKRWRIYGLSVIFLTLAVAATYWIIFAIAYYAYELATGASDTLLGPEDIGNPLRTAAAWALVGTTAWAIQWRTVATRDEESVLRQVYLYGFTFVGGAALALWGATATIYVVIAQLVGADDTTTAVAYFRQFILPVVGLLIGLALLAYHWSIIRRDAARRAPLRHSRESGNLEPGMQPTPVTPPTSDPASPTVIPSAGEESPQLSNTFKYIMSAVGLIALIPGIMVLLMTILFLLTEGDVLAPRKWRRRSPCRRPHHDHRWRAPLVRILVASRPRRPARPHPPHLSVRRPHSPRWNVALHTHRPTRRRPHRDPRPRLRLPRRCPNPRPLQHHPRRHILRLPHPNPPPRLPPRLHGRSNRYPRRFNCYPCHSERSRGIPTPATTPEAEQSPRPAYHTIPAPPYILPDWKPPRP